MSRARTDLISIQDVKNLAESWGWLTDCSPDQCNKLYALIRSGWVTPSEIAKIIWVFFDSRLDISEIEDLLKRRAESNRLGRKCR